MPSSPKSELRLGRGGGGAPIARLGMVREGGGSKGVNCWSCAVVRGTVGQAGVRAMVVGGGAWTTIWPPLAAAESTSMGEAG